MNGLAVVTGASSGIGREYARRLASRGVDLIAVGRRQERLNELATEFPGVTVQTVIADLSTQEGIDKVIAAVGAQPVTLLINNAGVAHYKPFTELPRQQAVELVGVKVLAPTLLAGAIAPGMVARGTGQIVNVAGMIAFSAPATLEQVPLRRAVYASSLAYAVALSQTLQAELSPHGVHVQALLPGVVATEFHERQGLDLSAVPRMSAADVVTASLRGLELGETVTAPGVEHNELLQNVFTADLAAFGAQSPQLAARYRS
ncbi:SDR family NAD(P)-dependent oxidoreductase [Cryobacterium frigoriphilum]|uniref:SDR family NAD(P)-dependent oxidoreductase n=1 Tax=Cryobacterium frigoriphilum TaxID=1259150 RepID=A0A4R9A224_9MICO|nr:SDR family NAD(P)-dependent oxidoreductase [Cryobacterium frigoriphilum]TFD50536.1 SDR family NAD(P)-dependent oxidoreductase [Cryobacterium frigoriphilum]